MRATPTPTTSQAVATAIALGLWDRERTGKGQAIQDTMLIANAWANHGEAYDFVGRPPYAIPDAELLRPPCTLPPVSGQGGVGVFGL